MDEYDPEKSHRPIIVMALRNPSVEVSSEVQVIL